MKQHDYAQVLRWIADGERIQRLTLDEYGKNVFKDAPHDAILLFLASGCTYNVVTKQDTVFRLAPRTITVNGVEVPAPESVAPDDCMLVFCADPASRCYNFCIRWCGDEYKEYLQRGLVYLNKEDAIARAKAMLLHE